MGRGETASHAGLYGVDLEPDPRYQRCCSNIFRPGRVLRDCCLGLVVLLVIAAVIGAMFLLVFFVLKDLTTDKTAPGDDTLVLNNATYGGLDGPEPRESRGRGGRREDEVNINDISGTGGSDRDHTSATGSEPTTQPEPEPEPTVEPEPEPSTTREPMLDLGLEMELFTTARPVVEVKLLTSTEPELLEVSEPELAAAPELDLQLFTSEPETTPEPEPSTTPEPEPSVTAEPEPSTTPEPEPSSTPEKEQSTTLEPEPSSSPEKEQSTTLEPFTISDSQPSSTEKSSVPTGLESSTTAGPAATVVPVSSEEPSTTAEPTSSEEPSATTEPTSSEGLSATAEPTSSEQLSTTAEPTSSEEPSTTAEPTSSEEPSTTAGSEPSAGDSFTSPSVAPAPGSTASPESSFGVDAAFDNELNQSESGPTAGAEPTAAAPTDETEGAGSTPASGGRDLNEAGPSPTAEVDSDGQGAVDGVAPTSVVSSASPEGVVSTAAGPEAETTVATVFVGVDDSAGTTAQAPVVVGGVTELPESTASSPEPTAGGPDASGTSASPAGGLSVVSAPGDLATAAPDADDGASGGQTFDIVVSGSAAGGASVGGDEIVTSGALPEWATTPTPPRLGAGGATVTERADLAEERPESSQLSTTLSSLLSGGALAALARDDISDLMDKAPEGRSLNSEPSAQRLPSGTEEESAESCGVGQFSCSGGGCVPASGRCDGAVDCRDGSDELSCPASDCPDGQFRCAGASAQCLPTSSRCDGTDDCPGAEDELGCPAAGSANGTEPSPAAQEPTAAAEEPAAATVDAAPAPTTEQLCPPGQLRCLDGACIQLEQVCDGVAQCPDGADELNCRE